MHLKFSLGTVFRAGRCSPMVKCFQISLLPELSFGVCKKETETWRLAIFLPSLCNIKKTKLNYPFLPAGLQPVSASPGKIPYSLATLFWGEGVGTILHLKFRFDMEKAHR